jgi:ribosomal protein L37AE/L43A
LGGFTLINFNEKFHELGVPDNPAFPTNDIGVSSLFGAVCGDSLRYVVEQKSWYWYTKNIWKQDIGSLKAMEHCKAFADAYNKYICSVCEDEKVQNFAAKLTNCRRRETVLADARSIAPIGLDTFDKNTVLAAYLNWLIEGYRLLRAEGLEPSARIKAAIAEYAVQSDVLGLFLNETIMPAEGERLSTSALYNIYTTWAKSRGNRPIRVQSFVGELRNRYEIFHDRKIGNVVMGMSLTKK